MKYGKLDKMFKDFDKQTPQSWKEKIITDLKGGDYNELLIWNSDEDISIDPFYTKQNRSASTGLTFNNSDWEIVEFLKISDEKENNKQLLHVLNWGATALNVDISSKEEINFDVLFKDIALDCIGLILTCNTNQFKHVEALLEYINDKYDLSAINFRLNFDGFYSFYKTGTLSDTLSEELTFLNTLQQTYSSPNIRLFSIDLRYLQNAGAKINQQLAYTLSIAQYYVDTLGKQVLPHIAIYTAHASNFFFETAKLRALRKLWKFYTSCYSVDSTCWIYAENSLRNKTVFDPYVNMLRTGSETLSAVVGGSDAVYTMPFDTIYKQQNEFSSRIARNQQVLIKGESYMDKVADVSNGAYYIEHLTSTFEKNAYALFQDIDANGWLSYLNQGTLKSELEVAQLDATTNFDEKKKPLLGTNLYPNLEETMSQDIEIEIDPYKAFHIPCRRISAETELERLANEK